MIDHFTGQTASARHLTAGLNENKRRAVHRLLTIMAHGEHIAMQGARLQASITDNTNARRFLLRQARHEQFHTRVFAHFASVIGSFIQQPDRVQLPIILAHWQQQIMSAARGKKLLESLLIQQVYLEGLGHVVLQGLDANLTAAGHSSARLLRLILRQEEQHQAFGTLLLMREIKHDPAVVPRLERLGPDLLAQAEELLAELADTFTATDTQHDGYLADFRARLPNCIPGVAA